MEVEPQLEEGDRLQRRRTTQIFVASMRRTQGAVWVRKAHQTDPRGEPVYMCVCVKGTLVSVLFYFNRDCLKTLRNPVSISDISQEVDCRHRSETSDMPVQVLTHPQVSAVFRRCGVGDGSPSLVS